MEYLKHSLLAFHNIINRLPLDKTLFIALCVVPLCIFANEEETVPEYPEKLKGSAEFGVINTTGTVSTQHIYARTYAVNERKNWRWYSNVGGSRTLVSDDLVSKRFDSLLQGDYKLLETDYFFVTLSYESDVYNGIRHRLGETLGYGHKFLDDEAWENRLELGFGYRHTIFEKNRNLTHVPIINVKGIIHYNFTEKSRFEQSLAGNAGEDSTIWTSVTALEQSIIDNFALKVSHTIMYTDNPPPEVKKLYSVTYVVLIYNF